LEIGGATAKMEILEKRMSELEITSTHHNRVPFDCNYTVIYINWREETGEHLDTKVQNLVQNGLGLRGVRPKRVMRLKSRDGKPGLVKIELATEEEKINVLRAKRNLNDTREYKRVYLCRSMPHAERLIQINFNQILKEMPNGNKFRRT
jgi:hypothetical protein